MVSWRLISAISLGSGLALMLSGCGGGGAVPMTGRLHVVVEKNPITVGETATLEVRLVDASGNPLPNAQFAVESTEPFVADVSGESGHYLIRALAQGRTLLRVREQRTGAQQTLEIAVNSPPIPAARIEIIAERTMLTVGETVPFRAVVYDQSGQVISVPVRWFSSDTAIVQVNTSGVVQARALGQASIIARLEDGSLSASVQVQVVQELPGTGGVDVSIN
jgi:uncharacterized protein YjdB